MNPKLIFSVCRKNLPTILSAGACGGVVLTGWLSYEAGKKEEKDWKKWISPALAALGTICCIAAAHKIHMSREAAMLAAIAFYKAAGEDFEEEVFDKFGDAGLKENVMTKDPEQHGPYRSDTLKIKIWEPYTKQYFYATQQEILWAELTANKLLSQRGHCSLNDILSFYSDPHLKKHKKIGDRLGWSWDDDMFQEESCYYYAGGWIDICPQFDEQDGECCFVMEYCIHPNDISEVTE
jgi:hypothetical protein